MTPIEASNRISGKTVYYKLQHRRHKNNAQIQLGQLMRTPDIRNVFRKGDMTNCSYKLCTMTEIIHNTLPSKRLNFLPGR